MSSTEIERHGAHGSSLTLKSDQEFWTDRQVAALRQLGVDRASNGDLAVFMHVAQRTGLDPFARQIYMIERQGKQTIQTGIDGFRLVARRAVDRARESLSISGGEWCGPDGEWRDVWIDSAPPAGARVVVKRGGQEFVGVALFREYAQTKRDGGLMAQWATRPAGMLAKCAEALALRKAFPMDLAGIYTDDEMDQAQRASTRPTSGGLGAVLADEDESPLLNTSSSLAKAMYAAIRDAGIDEDDRLPYISMTIGRPVGSTKEISEDECRQVLDALREFDDAQAAAEQQEVDQ